MNLLIIIALVVLGYLMLSGNSFNLIIYNQFNALVF